MTAAGSRGHTESRWWPWVVAAAAAATGVWVASALLMAGRGFDITDEGFYVLSYRWWDSTPRVFTGVQYVYGPVFERSDGASPGCGSSASSASWSCMSASAGRSWPGCGPADPARRRRAGGRWRARSSSWPPAGVVYGWQPLSPGYNDVVLLSSLVLAALLLWSMRVVSGGARLPVLAAACSGPPVVALVLAKWASAGVIVLFLVVLGVVALRSLDARGWVRYLLVERRQPGGEPRAGAPVGRSRSGRSPHRWPR